MKIEDLASSLREVEAVHGSDAVTLRSAVIRAAKQYGRSRYALGKALTLYKQELPHGAWAPAVSLISKRLQLSDRTLREIMSGYRQTLPLPPSVIDELKRAGIDPVSGRGREVVSILRDADLTTPSQAVEFATRKLSGAFKSPMPAGIHTERGIDGLSRYICDLEGRVHSGPHPLIREYPVTDPPLLPFAERGRRYTDA